MGGIMMTMDDVMKKLKVRDADLVIYERSYTQYQHCQLQMIRLNKEKYIVIIGNGELKDQLEGELNDGYKLCPLTHHNRLVLNKYFEFTKPMAFGHKGATIGLGDRLGLASSGHIQAIVDKRIHPVLAQQSIRELNLTDRTYADVLDAACFAVFQEGYTGGFGADGDHLKKEDDIQKSIELGISMLTLDCTDYIDERFSETTEAIIRAGFMELSQEKRSYYESKYLDQTFNIEGTALHFNEIKLMKNSLIYGKAIEYMEYIYRTYIQTADRAIDFEISIDETMTPTTPEAHFFIANELYQHGIEVNSMAPRFIGEFQKAIDYIGDLNAFEETLIVHAQIADYFGYKLSIHSGSDKFRVFSLIGKHTHGRFHVKTAGTNWLEAVRLVAQENPALYRKMHIYALEHFHEAKQYYHVTTDTHAIQDIHQVSDIDLPAYMDDDNARQLLHITYGLLLQAKDQNQNFMFKNAFYRTLVENEDKYAQGLIKHIGKHIAYLGIKEKE